MIRRWEKPTEPGRGISWIAFGKSIAGRRPDNQDYYDCFVVVRTRAAPLSVAIVADGVGGEQAGDLASRTAVNTIRGHIERHADEEASIPYLLAGAAVTANEAVIEAVWRRQNAPRAASTIVVAAIADDTLYLAHLGDSRAYLVRNGTATQLTRDHTVVEDEIEAGIITPDDIATHPELHTITRFVGDADGVKADLEILAPQYESVPTAPIDRRSLPLLLDDLIVLCTDGLTEVMSGADIAQIARQTSPDQLPGQLVHQARTKGTQDNITAVVVAQQSAARPIASRRLPWVPLLGLVILLAGIAAASAWAGSGPPAVPTSDAMAGASPQQDGILAVRATSTPERITAQPEGVQAATVRPTATPQAVQPADITPNPAGGGTNPAPLALPTMASARTSTATPTDVPVPANTGPPPTDISTVTAEAVTATAEAVTATAATPDIDSLLPALALTSGPSAPVSITDTVSATVEPTDAPLITDVKIVNVNGKRLVSRESVVKFVAVDTETARRAPTATLR